MNAQTQISNGNQSVGLLNLEAFELSQRIAKMLSSSTLVPEQYRATVQKKAGKDEYGNQLWREEPNPNGLSNCVIALNMSNRMGADPLMVMQNLYLVNGRPSWSSQFIMAGINSSGRFSALRFEIQDLGEKEVECTETVWENRKPKKITKAVKIHDFSCVAWAIERETGERLESSKITIEMAVKEGWYTKEGSKWQTMSEQMLRYRAASFFGRVYAPELLMGLRSAEEEQDRIIDVTPIAESKVINASDFKNIKNLILKAKTLVDLEELESSIYALSDESERNELIKLWKASADKHKIIDAEVSAKKPEPQHEEAPPVSEKKSKEVKAHYLDTFKCASSVVGVKRANEKAQSDSELTDAHKKDLDLAAQKIIAEIEEHLANSTYVASQEKKPSSADLKKDYLLKMNKAESVGELNMLHEEFIINDALTGPHLAYLKDAYMQAKEKFKPVEQPAAQQPVINEIKSNSIASGLKNSIQDAANIDALTAVAQTIRDSKPNMTQDHLNDVLNVYSTRKKFLEDQQDMFADVVEEPWIDGAIKRIEAAKNQDDINAEYLDPTSEYLSDQDKQRLDLAAQKREAELFG